MGTGWKRAGEIGPRGEGGEVGRKWFWSRALSIERKKSDRKWVRESCMTICLKTAHSAAKIQNNPTWRNEDYHERIEPYLICILFLIK